MKDTGTLKVPAPADCEIVLTRVFDASGRFRSARSISRRAERFVSSCAAGTERRWDARLLPEIVPPERSFPMESFDGHAGESQVTAVFVEQEGKTTLTATVLYPSREVRDAVLKSGMEHRAAESYDRLAELFLSGGKSAGRTETVRRGE